MNDSNTEATVEVLFLAGGPYFFAAEPQEPEDDRPALRLVEEPKRS